MRLDWNEEIITKINWIDTQHKNLLTKTNEFMSSVAESKGDAEIKKTVQLLEDYANVHFATEERYMLKHRYSHYSSHKAHHERFGKAIEFVRKEYITHGSSSDLAKKIGTILFRYWANHIPKYDKPLAVFLRKMNS